MKLSYWKLLLILTIQKKAKATLQLITKIGAIQQMKRSSRLLLISSSPKCMQNTINNTNGNDFCCCNRTLIVGRKRREGITRNIVENAEVTGYKR